MFSSPGVQFLRGPLEGVTFDLSNFKTSVCVNAIYSNVHDTITSNRQQLYAG